MDRKMPKTIIGIDMPMGMKWVRPIIAPEFQPKKGSVVLFLPVLNNRE